MKEKTGGPRCPEGYRLKEQLDPTSPDYRKTVKAVVSHTADCPECDKVEELTETMKTILFEVKWQSRQELIEFFDYINNTPDVDPLTLEKDLTPVTSGEKDLSPEVIKSIVERWRESRKVFENVLNREFAQESYTSEMVQFLEHQKNDN